MRQEMTVHPDIPFVERTLQDACVAMGRGRVVRISKVCTNGARLSGLAITYRDPTEQKNGGPT